MASRAFVIITSRRAKRNPCMSALCDGPGIEPVFLERTHNKPSRAFFCVAQAEGLVEQTRGKPVLVLKAGVRLAIALWAILVIKL